MQRRKFLTLSSTAALLPAVSLIASAGVKKMPEPTVQVSFIGDGLDLSPAAYAQLLMQLASNDKLVPDNYSRGGCVEDLEKTIDPVFDGHAFMSGRRHPGIILIVHVRYDNPKKGKTAQCVDDLDTLR